MTLGKSARHVRAVLRGKRGEAYVVQHLNNATAKLIGLGLIEPCARNLEQSRNGGIDLINTGCFAIEIKNRVKLDLGNWWKTLAHAADELDKEPVLIYNDMEIKRWMAMYRLEGDLVCKRLSIFCRYYNLRLAKSAELS